MINDIYWEHYLVYLSGIDGIFVSPLYLRRDQQSIKHKDFNAARSGKDVAVGHVI